MQQTGGHWPGVETSGEDFFWRPGPGLGCSAEDVCMFIWIVILYDSETWTMKNKEERYLKQLRNVVTLKYV